MRDADLTPTGRELRDPAATLIECVDEKGLKHTVISFDEEYRGHVALTTGVDLIMSFMAYPMVTGLVECNAADTGRARFAYPTGTIWTAKEVMRGFDQVGQTVGARAALEICYLGGMILQEAGETGPLQGCFSHGNLSPWRLGFKADGQLQIFGYGLAQVEMYEFVKGDAEHIDNDSIRYAPPERLEGQPEQPSSDTYSLAVIAHELITGKPLFDHDDGKTMWESVKMAEGVQRMLEAKGVPKAVRELLSSALIYDPDTRLSGTQFVDAVGNLLDDPKIEGRTLADVMTRMGSKKKRSSRKLVNVKGTATAAFKPADLKALAEAEDDLDDEDLEDDEESEDGEEKRWGSVTREGTTGRGRGGRRRARRRGDAKKDDEKKGSKKDAEDEEPRRRRRRKKKGDDAEPSAEAPRRRRRRRKKDDDSDDSKDEKTGDESSDDPDDSPPRRRRRRRTKKDDDASSEDDKNASSDETAKADEKAEAEKKAKDKEAKAKKEADEKAKAKKEADEKAKKEADEKAQKEADEKAKAEKKAKDKKEADEKAKKEADEKAKADEDADDEPATPRRRRRRRTSSDSDSEDSGSDGSDDDGEDEATASPRRRRRRKTADPEEAEAVATPRRRRRRRKSGDSDDDDSSSDDGDSSKDDEPATPRRRRRRKKKKK